MRIFFTILCALIILSCQPTSEEPMDKTKIEKEVRLYLEAYLETIRKEGLASEFQYLDTTDRFFWVPPGFNQLIKIDSVKAVVMERADFYQLVDNRWEYLKMDVLTNNHVIYTGKLNCLWVDTTGVEARYRMLETGLVIRTPAGWKITGGQSSIVNP